VLDDTIVARALVIAPLEYASALTTEKRMKDLGHSVLTLEDIRSCMDTLYITNYSEPLKVQKVEQMESTKSVFST
jgi:hypothetical protein